MSHDTYPTYDDIYDAVATEFDSEYYLANNEDVREAGLDPIAHFISEGWKEGRNPNDNFNTLFYMETHKDVASAGINPFFHYIIAGKAEGRQARYLSEDQLIIEKIRKEFDAEYYLSRNKDVAENGVDPLEHFAFQGWKEGRNPNSTFSVNYYLTQHEDVKQAEINPFYHYIVAGKAEGRAASPVVYPIEKQQLTENNDNTEYKWQLCLLLKEA